MPIKKDFNIQSLIRENVKGLKPYSSARDEYVADGSQMVFLDANENPFENGVNRYPDPQQRRLKSVLMDRKAVPIENMLLGNGSDEVLDLIFRTFCEPKVDNIITLPPTYGMYKVLAAINHIENREILLTENFQPDVDKILERADENSKLLFLCSPNNPTGNSFSEKKMIQLLENFSGLVVIDEAYIDFSDGQSWSKKLKEYPNLIVTQTLSKAYGLAGIRLGICLASKAIISVLNKIKPPYNINELTQNHALKRLQSVSRIRLEIAEILHQKKMVIKVLKHIDFIEKVYPSDANFILVKVDDADVRYQQLLNKGIVTRNRSNQPLCENTLRFTIGTPEENIKLVMALKEIN
ncbi:histidinol-phosphate aminotransferase [Pricia antarctica]|uniref:Histidinol-phosphate aminotransferase n=1 Tax=Pricia antarctica TaxID=641691 RepID=A0A1G7BNR9_9FLAO|nr:histidinol-phosphate transaminase [Pricia antarctica]SDE28719.1 histidinol-phosphate aminotransferase [Pricia antarctica]